MNYCDSHCHPSDEKFTNDLEKVVKDAIEKGMKYAIGNACGYEDALQLLRTCSMYTEIKPCIGIHPWKVQNESLERMLDLIREEKSHIVGIGEIGLDCAKHLLEGDSNAFEKQKEFFREQIKLAKELNLPVSVHSRYAGHYAMEILLESGIKKVQLHAYDGSKKSIKQGINAGFYFSVGNRLFEENQTINLVKLVPISQLLLETDSPDMSLTDERNVFSNISFTNM